MTDALRAAIGITLLAAGLAAFGYAVYLEMIRAVPLRWWDRAALLAPVGLISMLMGMLLTL